MLGLKTSLFMQLYLNQSTAFQYHLYQILQWMPICLCISTNHQSILPQHFRGKSLNHHTPDSLTPLFPISPLFSMTEWD